MMRRVASLCLSLGAVVAVIGVVGIALGFRPSALPSALLDVAAYKLLFIAAGGLLVGGAILGRASRRARRGRGAAPDVSSGAEVQGALSPEHAPAVAPPSAERVRRER